MAHRGLIKGSRSSSPASFQAQASRELQGKGPTRSWQQGRKLLAEGTKNVEVRAARTGKSRLARARARRRRAAELRSLRATSREFLGEHVARACAALQTGILSRQQLFGGTPTASGPSGRSSSPRPSTAPGDRPATSISDILDLSNERIGPTVNGTSVKRCCSRNLRTRTIENAISVTKRTRASCPSTADFDTGVWGVDYHDSKACCRCGGRICSRTAFKFTAHWRLRPARECSASGGWSQSSIRDAQQAYLRWSSVSRQRNRHLAFSRRRQRIIIRGLSSRADAVTARKSTAATVLGLAISRDCAPCSEAKIRLSKHVGQRQFTFTLVCCLFSDMGPCLSTAPVLRGPGHGDGSL